MMLFTKEKPNTTSTTITPVQTAQAYVVEKQSRVDQIARDLERVTGEVDRANVALAMAIVDGGDTAQLAQLAQAVASAKVLADAMQPALVGAREGLAIAQEKLRAEEVVIAQQEINRFEALGAEQVLTYLRGLWAAWQAMLAYRDTIQKPATQHYMRYGLSLGPVLRWGFGYALEDFVRLFVEAEAKWPALYKQAGLPPAEGLRKL